jgi:hypothetical protein
MATRQLVQPMFPYLILPSVKLKEPKDWKYIGKSLKRLHIPTKVNGTAVFGIDVKLPGTKHPQLQYRNATIHTLCDRGGRKVRHHPLLKGNRFVGATDKQFRKRCVIFRLSEIPP